MQMRWKWEYMTALHERHKMKHKTKVVKIEVMDVVITKGEDKCKEKLEDQNSRRIIQR